MCSITGYLTFKEPALSRPYQLANLLKASEVRGRDGFGFDMMIGDAIYGRRVLPPDPADYLRFTSFLASSPQVFLSNHRAEPTTEFVKEKRKEDQQPYRYLGTVVVHNGTIANDKEILRSFDIQPPTKIDSYALVVAKAKGMNLFTEVKGSIAALFYDRISKKLTAMRNWNPLTILYLPEDGMWVFSSLLNAKDFFPGAVQKEFPPYSIGTNFLADGGFTIKTVIPENRTRGIVVCSGGLDSVTVAKIATMECQDVRLLHFAYGCQAEAHEMGAVDQVGRVLGCKVEVVDMCWLKRLGGSTLTEEGHISDGVSGAEFAHEWVPARNTAMIGIAAAYADRYDCGRIYLGLNLEESGAYPDNTVEFYKEFNHVLDAGTQARPEVVNPLACMTKKEIVAKALEIGAPIELTWSCYKSGTKQCGKCGPCHMRQVAFQMLGKKDPIEYENPI